ncbi:MAG: hypothetical protein CMM02_05900 [Rhodopirellula sp.]|jgi:hypothetical protein|nr:hypothetical protein [Rhodopirellula sp.]
METAAAKTPTDAKMVVDDNEEYAESIPLNYQSFTFCTEDGKAKLEAITENMARAMSTFLSIRGTLYVNKGGLITNVGVDAPTAQGYCASCGVPVKRTDKLSLYCPRCRRIPTRVTSGSTLIKTMYTSSHPNLQLTEEKVKSIAILSRTQEFVYETLALATAMRNGAQTVLASNKKNFIIPVELIQNHNASKTPYLYSVADPVVRTGAVLNSKTRPRIGKIGPQISLEVARRAEHWLHVVDSRMAIHFKDILPPEDGNNRVHSEMQVGGLIRYFASMIGDFTAFTEVKKDDSDLGLSAAACEHVIRIHTLDCEPAAENRAKREIRAMSLLLKMLKADDWQIFDGQEERALVIGILQETPPELCDIQHETNVGELQEVLASNAYSKGRWGAEARLCAFRAKVGTNSASLTRVEELVSKAIGDAADAARRILDAHRKAGDRMIRVLMSGQRSDINSKAAVVPTITWRSEGRMWFFRNPYAGASPLVKRRFGLNRTSMRIVMLASFVQQLLGPADLPTFEPGVVDAFIVRSIAMAERERAHRAFCTLREQIKPLYAGVEFAQARQVVLEALQSHVENEVQMALVPLSNFSMQDIVTVFHWDSRLLPIVLDKLTGRTREFLVDKPSARYKEFPLTTLKLFLPIISAFRNRVGVDTLACSNPLASLLLTIPAVYAWALETQQSGNAGSLELSTADAKLGAPAAVKALKNLNSLVRLRRIGYSTTNSYVFDTSKLKALVAPQVCASTK